MSSSQTLPTPQGPEYTPCGCSHIEPEHRPDAGACLSCGCAAYRPGSGPTDEDFLVALESALEKNLLPAPGFAVLERTRDDVVAALAPLVAQLRTAAPAVPAGQTPATDGDVVDRIRRVLARVDGFDFDSLEPHDYQIQATAIAAVLPASVDRAAVLREAADIAESLRQFERCTGARKSAQVSENVGILRVADELRRLAAPSAVVVRRATDETPGDGLRCVCGDPVQLMDDSDSSSWIHSPGSDTPCLNARPRCPDCQMPHDLSPSMALVCASILASIRDRDAPPAVGAQQPKEA